MPCSLTNSSHLAARFSASHVSSSGALLQQPPRNTLTTRQVCNNQLPLEAESVSQRTSISLVVVWIASISEFRKAHSHLQQLSTHNPVTFNKLYIILAALHHLVRSTHNHEASYNVELSTCHRPINMKIDPIHPTAWRWWLKKWWAAELQIVAGLKLDLHSISRDLGRGLEELRAARLLSKDMHCGVGALLRFVGQSGTSKSYWWLGFDGV